MHCGHLVEEGPRDTVHGSPHTSTTRLLLRVQGPDEARRERERAAGALDWAAWWDLVAADPVLAEPAARRFALLGDPRRPAPTRRDRPTTTAWHADTLRAPGFAEARQAWCSPSDALMVALR